MNSNQHSNTLERRDFLKFMGGSACSLAVLTNGQYLARPLEPWYEFDWLPHVQEPIALVKPALIDSAGYLNLVTNIDGRPFRSRVELFETAWNRKHFDQWYRLRREPPWAIVLHWDGGPNHPRSLAQLVDGLNNSEDIVSGRSHENSAHFGVGNAPLSAARGEPTLPLAIAQLQRPWLDGTPLIASHLRYTIGKPDQREGTPGQVLKVMRLLGIESSLVDIHQGPWLDPNFRSLAIEISGRRFDRNFPEQLPAPELIGNLLTLIRSLMLSYGLRAWDVVGHLELQHDKPDPGKLFMAYVRFLIGALAMVNVDTGFRSLTFGSYQSSGQLRQQAHQYFNRLNEFTRLLTTDEQYQAWDNHTQCTALVSHLGRQPDRLRSSLFG